MNSEIKGFSRSSSIYQPFESRRIFQPEVRKFFQIIMALPYSTISRKYILEGPLSMISKVQVSTFFVSWECNSKIIISRFELGDKMTMTNSKMYFSIYKYFLIRRERLFGANWRRKYSNWTFLTLKNRNLSVKEFIRCSYLLPQTA